MEIMVSMSLFLLVLILVGTIFNLAQRSYRTGAVHNELSQNVRVFFDRVSRELRQANELVTDISATTTEIMFMDGHDNSYISYVRYYLSGTDLYRRHTVYFHGTFETVPEDQYEKFGATDEFGVPVSEHEKSNDLIGEYFNGIYFKGDNGLVRIIADLEKSGVSVGFDTQAYIRNLR